MLTGTLAQRLSKLEAVNEWGRRMEMQKGREFWSLAVLSLGSNSLISLGFLVQSGGGVGKGRSGQAGQWEDLSLRSVCFWNLGKNHCSVHSSTGAILQRRNYSLNC